MVANEMGPTRKSLQQYCSVPVEAVLDMPLTKNAAIARQLLTEADAYNEMQDKEMAYCLYKRFCTLIVEVFPRHKEYRGASNRLQMRGCMEMSQGAIESLTLIAKELDEGDLKNKEEEDARKHLSDMESVEERSRETAGGDSAILPPHTSETSMALELANQSTELAGRDSATSSPKNQKPLTLNEAMEILNVSKEAKGIEKTTTTVPCVPHLQTEAILPPSASDIPTISDAAFDLKRDRGGMGWMRPVFIPCSMVSAFTDVARPNTELGAEGVETCAILAGSIVTSNKCGGLQMTHLIFPEQVGGPNTCDALGEEALFEYMLNCKLITIGWIHTHPRQNCFLSSIDLHTQCGYQTMLPEAIAIVVAPRDVKGDHVGIFRLHTPHGIKLIQDCKLRGFHTHPEGTPIYGDVNVSWLDRAPLKVVDLRPKGK
eukprot:491469_1